MNEDQLEQLALMGQKKLAFRSVTTFWPRL